MANNNRPSTPVLLIPLCSLLFQCACGHHEILIAVSHPPETTKFASYFTPEMGWQTPALVNPSTYKLQADSSYKFVITCVDSGALVTGSFDTEELIAEVDDGDQVVGGFCGTLTPVSPITVDGDIQQASQVTLGRSFAVSVVGPWHFSLPVAPGLYDLLVSDAFPGLQGEAGKVVLRRDLELAADTMIAQIDLASEGFDLVPSIANYQALNSETASSTVLLNNPNVQATVSASNNTMTLGLPSSATRTGDEQVLIFTASSTVAIRTAVVAWTSNIQLVLLPPVTGTVGPGSTNTITATWSALPAVFFTTIRLTVQDPHSDSLIGVSATKNAVENEGLSSLTFDPNIPGFDTAFHPAWIESGGDAYLSIHNDSPTERYKTITL